MTGRLTLKQRTALAHLDSQWRTGPRIADKISINNEPPPLEGLHQTLASLVRRDLAERNVARGIVQYRITDAGAIVQRRIRGAR